MKSEDNPMGSGKNNISRRGLMFAGIGAVFIAGTAFAGYEAYWWTPELDTVPLTVKEAHEKALRGEILLVDIRRPEEWKETGVGEGAYPLDMRRDDFAEELAKLRKSKGDIPVALMCARGVRSARTARRLEDAGVQDIHDVPEGMLGSSAGPGWLQSGLPTDTFNKETN